jgi:hypothetical protein
MSSQYVGYASREGPTPGKSCRLNRSMQHHLIQIFFLEVVFMIEGKRRGLSAEQQAELWKRWKAGQSLHPWPSGKTSRAESPVAARCVRWRTVWAAHPRRYAGRWPAIPGAPYRANTADQRAWEFALRPKAYSSECQSSMLLGGLRVVGE